MTTFNAKGVKLIGATLTKDLDLKICLNVKVGDEWHSENCTESEGASITPDIEQVSISELDPLTACSECVFTEYSSNYHHLLKLVAAEEFKEELYGPLPDLHVDKLEMMEWNLNTHLAILDSWLQLPGKLTGLARARAEEFIESGDAMKERLLQLQQSEPIRKGVIQLIVNLQSTRPKEVSKDDSSMVLIGVSPFGAIYNRTAKLALESHLIFSNKDSLVAYAPYCVYRFLEALKERGSIGPEILVLLAQSPEDALDRYAAARLWDPLGKGPLADLEVAVKAAKAL